MKNFISIEEFNKLSEKDKKLYEVTYLDYETKCVPYGYILKNRRWENEINIINYFTNSINSLCNKTDK